ncbi:FecR family protein [Sphingomonas sp.]|jgi:transmembrane sensor|uniref:FecR family protein n=1 Tax=Sphingomonas sp. TaxID=28214 RepID=UPI002EDAF46D
MTSEPDAAEWWSRMQGPDAEQHRPAFEQWLAAAPANSEAYSRLERAWQASSGLGATEMGRNRSLERHRSPFFVLTGPRVAAIAAAAAAILLVVFLRPGSESPAPQPVQTAALMQTAIGEIRTLRLPDGSKMTLDTDSQVRVRYARDARRVELVRGRVRFEVRADPSRMFVVEAGDRLVSIPEGRFDTEIRPAGVCVSAWKGPIEIRGRGASYTQAAVFRMAPGHSMIFPAGRPQTAAAPASEQWVAGMLVYKSVPLADVLAETNRYSKQHIVLSDRSLGQLRVTGTFRPVPVGALAASLAAAFELHLRPGADGNLILERP